VKDLYKLACVVLISAGLLNAAFAAGDTEKGQTPAAPAAAGADNQPDKPPTPVMTPSAKVMRDGSKEEEKGAASARSQSPASDKP
jgi:hypothetical protein